MENQNLFNLVKEVKEGEKVITIVTGCPEFYIYSKVFVQKGPLKKEYLLRFNVEVNTASKTISTYETDCYDTVTYINDLVVDENKFKEAMTTFGLGSHNNIFDDTEQDWDSIETYEKCLKLEPVLRTMYFDRGYAYEKTLNEQQKLNISEGRPWYKDEKQIEQK